MAGIIEKQSGNGLFESEIEFTGKYANYARYLRDEIHLFPTFREIYVTSAILGFMEGKKGTDDNKQNEVRPASIFPTELARRRPELKFIYRIIMLLDNESNLSLEECKNRAFRDDPEENKDTIRKNMLLFNSYACGGLEYLYNQFEMKNTDDMALKVKKLNDLLDLLAIKNNLKEDKELPSFNPSL